MQPNIEHASGLQDATQELKEKKFEAFITCQIEVAQKMGYIHDGELDHAWAEDGTAKKYSDVFEQHPELYTRALADSRDPDLVQDVIQKMNETSDQHLSIQI